MSYPQYPTGGQPPYGGPPQPPKQGMSTGAKIGIGCGGCLGLSAIGFVSLLLIGALASTGDESTVSTAPAATPGSERPAGEAAADDEEEPAAEETHPGLGDAVEHGDWEITVGAIAYDVPTSDLDEFFAEEPSGQWVVVDIEATNTSSGPQYFDGSSQVLMDDSGSMYSSDIMASTGLGLLEEANPGSTVSGQLAYDVPADLTFEYMLVNGETFLDDGVRVNLD